MSERIQYPLLPLRGIVLFPGVMSRVDVGRLNSVTALEKAMEREQTVFAVAQKDEELEDITVEDLYDIGTIAKVRQIVRLPDETLRVFLTGEKRARLEKKAPGCTVMEAVVTPIEQDETDDSPESQAVTNVAKVLFKKYIHIKGITGENTQSILGAEDVLHTADRIVAMLDIKASEKQRVLEAKTTEERGEMAVSYLQRENELAALEERIQQRVKEGMDEHQREYYLREQLHVIHEELGDAEEMQLERLRKRLAESKIAGEAREKVEEELRHYESCVGNGPESSISRSYIETMLDLPWGKYTNAQIKIDRAKKVLEEDHYGLAKVKERIVEYLAVHAMNQNSKSPILCLVGPPGVGKTSIARSVARAAGRKYVRMSLGGLHDEAELRGHRRTYLGAIPGRIISLIKTAGVMDPLFLFDEIDKMASDYKGDPASAMLEVLDPEQNNSFSDHYLEAPFDLSKVMFMTTANSLEDIPEPLRDRMEIIEIESYTLEEKVEIAKRHLWPKQLQEHGFKKTQLKITDNAIRALIDGYTREAGVRKLERELAAVCRKNAVKYLETPEEERKNVTVKPEMLEELLGKKRFSRMETLKAPEVGVINGLAWTPYGGETLSIEVAVMPGKGNVELTGQLGDVMKESAKAAYSYIRTKAKELQLEDEYYNKQDLHIHVPEGATPKDGPSAGVAMTCAMVSALTGKPARQDVAMTGEITLTGRVLPIGGVKEKLLAAHRMGITTVLLPKENEKDLEELPAEIREKLDIHFLTKADQALDIVLSIPQK